MFKTGYGEILLKLGVLCLTLVCQSCPMGYLLLAGSAPRALHSVILLAKEPLQGHIILPLHLKVVSSHQMTRKEREEGVQCPASRCIGIHRKLHLFTGTQVPTEDMPVSCEHTLLSLVLLIFRELHLLKAATDTQNKTFVFL